jgi:hypothetical protein
MIDRLTGFFGFTRMPFGRDLAPGMLHRQTAHNEAVARIGWCVAERCIGVSPARSADLGQRRARAQHGGGRGVTQPMGADHAQPGPSARVDHHRSDGVADAHAGSRRTDIPPDLTGTDWAAGHLPRSRQGSQVTADARDVAAFRRDAGAQGPRPGEGGAQRGGRATRHPARNARRRRPADDVRLGCPTKGIAGVVGVAVPRALSAGRVHAATEHAGIAGKGRTLGSARNCCIDIGGRRKRNFLACGSHNTACRTVGTHRHPDTAHRRRRDGLGGQACGSGDLGPAHPKPSQAREAPMTYSETGLHDVPTSLRPAHRPTSNRCRAGSARTRICGSQLAAEHVDEHEIAVERLTSMSSSVCASPAPPDRPGHKALS